jgi:glycosyltransferase involved in cell wall biosynthesis
MFCAGAYIPVRNSSPSSLRSEIVRYMSPTAVETIPQIGKLHVAVALSGLRPGGAERVVSILSREWVELGYQVTIMCFEEVEESSYYPIDPRIKVVRLGFPPVQSGAFASIRAVVLRTIALRRAFKEVRPDVIVSFLSRTNILTLISTLGTKTPVIISERNNPKKQQLGFTWNLLRKLVYGRAFGMVTMTKAALEYFPIGMRARSWVIPNPVIIPQKMMKTGVNRLDGLNVLTAVGRLVDQKGFDILIAAFARVAPAFPDWRLVIWGEGPDRNSLEQLVIALGMRQRISLPGVSERPGSWVENADAFVLSSRYEGWGNVLLEAMASGLPVVSFDCEWGPAEMIQDGVDGILVDRDDTIGLSNAMATVMKDKTLRETLGANAALSAQKYSHEKILADWNSVLSAAVKGSPV